MAGIPNRRSEFPKSGFENNIAIRDILQLAVNQQINGENQKTGIITG